jgi:hypothetical protein
MSMQTFVLKFSDRMPIIIGMNEQSSKLRFGLKVASNADDTAMVPSTKRAKFDDEALAGTDAENSTLPFWAATSLWLCVMMLLTRHGSPLGLPLSQSAPASTPAC